MGLVGLSPAACCSMFWFKWAWVRTQETLRLHSTSITLALSVLGPKFAKNFQMYN